MAHVRMVEGYVRQLLAARFGDRVAVESDGGRPVLLLPGPAALRDRSNEIPATLPYGRVFLFEDRVVVEDTLLGVCVDREVLDNAVDLVAWVAHVHGPQLAEVGRGRPKVPDDVEEHDERTAAPGEQSSAAGQVPSFVYAAGQPDATATHSDGASQTPVAVNAAGYL